MRIFNLGTIKLKKNNLDNRIHTANLDEYQKSPIFKCNFINFRKKKIIWQTIAKNTRFTKVHNKTLNLTFYKAKLTDKHRRYEASKFEIVLNGLTLHLSFINNLLKLLNFYYN